jgi:hypothetical protein
MIEVLVVLNNYLHDFAIALVALASLASLYLANHARRSDSGEFKDLFLFIYPRLSRLITGAMLFVIAAAVVRVLSLSEFEWADATRNYQLRALKVKYVMLLSIFLSGIYFWVAAHKKVREIKNRLE